MLCILRALVKQYQENSRETRQTRQTRKSRKLFKTSHRVSICRRTRGAKTTFRNLRARLLHSHPRKSRRSIHLHRSRAKRPEAARAGKNGRSGFPDSRLPIRCRRRAESRLILRRPKRRRQIRNGRIILSPRRQRSQARQS